MAYKEVANDAARGVTPMVQPATRPPLVRGEWYLMTWEEFLEWSPDEGQSEWVNGRGIVHPSQSSRHAQLLVFALGLFDSYLRVFDRGTLFMLRFLMHLPSIPSARSPDLMVVLPEHQDRITKWWLEGPADFVLEYVSDDSAERDLVEKREEFERAGVPEYLAVDSRLDHDVFTFLRRNGNGRFGAVTPDKHGRYHSTVLPGLWLDPAWFRQDTLPSPEDVMLEIAPDAFRRYLLSILERHSVK
jgi:Uma2 family endonuclease